MKLLLAVAALIGVGVVVTRSNRPDADLWHEATAPGAGESGAGESADRTPPTGT